MGIGTQGVLARALLNRTPTRIFDLPARVFNDRAELEEAIRALRFLRADLTVKSVDEHTLGFINRYLESLNERLNSGEITQEELRMQSVELTQLLERVPHESYSFASAVTGARMSLYADGQKTTAALNEALAKRSGGGSDIRLSPQFSSFLIILVEKGYVDAKARVWGLSPVQAALELKDLATLPEALYRFAITETDGALVRRAIAFLIEGTTIDGFPNHLFVHYLYLLAQIEPDLFERDHLSMVQIQEGTAYQNTYIDRVAKKLSLVKRLLDQYFERR